MREGDVRQRFPAYASALISHGEGKDDQACGLNDLARGEHDLLCPMGAYGQQFCLVVVEQQQCVVHVPVHRPTESNFLDMFFDFVLKVSSG